MKIHPIAQALENTDLELRETLKVVWTGGLTAVITYRLRKPDGTILASYGFHYNRSPATYEYQGCGARMGTERYRALDYLLLHVQRYVDTQRRSSSVRD